MKTPEEMKAALEQIKSLVCGDRAPHWVEDGWTVTGTRGTIADICDEALGNGPPSIRVTPLGHR